MSTQFWVHELRATGLDFAVKEREIDDTLLDPKGTESFVHLTPGYDEGEK